MVPNAPAMTNEIRIEETDTSTMPLGESEGNLGKFLSAISHNESWFLTWGGMAIGVTLTLVTLLAIGLTTAFGQASVGISLPEAATVPVELYMAGFIGSLAFIWSRIVVGENDLDEDERNDTEDVTTLMLRRMVLGLFGSLPLVFGVYVLAGVLAITEVGLLGAAFLTGMFVKVIYETFRELVQRVTIPRNEKPAGDSTAGTVTIETSGDPEPASSGRTST